MAWANRDGGAPALSSAVAQSAEEGMEGHRWTGVFFAGGRRRQSYVFARQGEEETLLCLDAATGKELWRSSQPISFEMHPAATAHGKGPKSTPVVNNGSVYTLGISGVLSAHDARTGKLKWRHEFSKQYPKDLARPMAPPCRQSLTTDLVIAHVGGENKGARSSLSTPETGAVKWTNDMDGPAYASPILGEARWCTSARNLMPSRISSAWISEREAAVETALED